MARGTTKSFWKKDIVASQESCNSVNIQPFYVQAHGADDVLEWLGDDLKAVVALVSSGVVEAGC